MFTLETHQFKTTEMW